MTKFISPVEVAHSPPVLAVLALLSHLVLHRGEWDNRFHIWFGIWFLGFGGIAMSEYAQGPQSHSISSVLKTTTTAAVLYHGVLSTSILAHRVLFHRLRKVMALPLSMLA